ncbi:MAG TPA: hypothetical protein VHV32_00855 [Candidatus Angelobacter sp.]|jgi:hypothetical protein|nr:hypothetical protein [Candidatus Angelobacter sp.]
MATYQAIGSGPISFVDAHQSQQEIPLSAITFGPNGVDASAWPLYTANKAVVDGLLKQMVVQGFISPGTKSAAAPSLKITASEPGQTGNATTVTFVNPSASAGTVDVTVTANEIYPGLALSTIGNALGTSAAQANGLVFLESNNNKVPKSSSGNISGGPNFDYIVPEPGGDAAGAFTLKAAAAGLSDADAQLIKIVVTLDPLPATTFTLQVSWTKTVTGVTLATLENNATNPFAILVSFTGAAGGPLPAAGTVSLLGGAAATSSPAVNATATVFSS